MPLLGKMIRKHLKKAQLIRKETILPKLPKLATGMRRINLQMIQPPKIRMLLLKKEKNNRKKVIWNLLQRMNRSIRKPLRKRRRKRVRMHQQRTHTHLPCPLL